MIKFAIIPLLMLSATVLHSQSAVAAKPFTVDAEVKQAGDGTLIVTASNPRPLWQALEAVRRRYGWTIDYEDPVYPPQSLSLDSTRRPVLAGGTMAARIEEPRNSSANEEKRVLQQVVNQYNAQFATKYQIVSESDSRYDVVPSSGSILDRPVKIDDQQRSLRAEIDAVIANLSQTSGVKVVQGGLMDNGMEQLTVSLNHSDAVPVRQLLREILSHVPNQKVWLLTYEPNGGYFGIGVQSAEQWIDGPNGETKVKLVKNPSIALRQNEGTN